MTRAPRQSGFTLLELVLALVVIAAVLGMAAPSFSGWGRGQKLRGAAEDFVTVARFGRVQALQTASPHRLIISPSDGRYYLTVQEGETFVEAPGQLTRGRVPQDFQIQWTDQESAQRGFVEFAPNGRAQAARVRLTSQYGEQIDVECASPTEGFRIIPPGEVR
jgi:type II secretion system protein H